VSVLREHLVVVPVVLPLAAGALMLLLEERRYALKGAISLVSTLLLIAAAAALVPIVDAPATAVYRIGDWPAPFAIVLVADRLSVLLVLLTSVLGFAALLFSLARWHRAAPRFHVLLQILLMGVNGAFLTGDLFNLFVFFEVLLAASYGLALHGAGTARVRASLHYIVVNLTASLIFLIGVSLLYGVTGTLNMADLAVRIPAVPEADRGLVEAGAAILGIAFLVKAAMWPLGFWLPGVYGAASPPSAALFAILTKVGVYAVLRVGLLLFGGADPAPAFGDWLLYGGCVTLLFGSVGMLASQDLQRIAAYSLVVSAGTLLAAVGMADAAVTGAALYYLVASTLGVGAFFLLSELVERARNPAADMLALTAEAFGIEEEEEPEEEVGVAIPATIALLGFVFACSALVIAGLPPLPGFIAKFALFAGLLAPTPVPDPAWLLIVLMTLSGLAAVISLARAGVRAFWTAPEGTVPRVRVIEFSAVGLLVLACLALTVAAGPVMRYVQDAAAGLHDPRGYVGEVLSGSP